MVVAPWAALWALSRARMIYVSLFAAVYLLYPRFAEWEIVSSRLSSLTVSLFDLSVDVELDIGVSIHNPNYLGAYLYDANLDLFRLLPPRKMPNGKHLPVVPQAFGTASAGSYAVPPRGAFHLQSRISLPSLPLAEAFSLLHEIVTHHGVIKVRGVGTANVRAAKNNMTVLIDCVQHVNTLAIPSRLEHSECSYRITSSTLSELYGKSSERFGPVLVELFSTFDWQSGQEWRSSEWTPGEWGSSCTPLRAPIPPPRVLPPKQSPPPLQIGAP